MSHEEVIYKAKDFRKKRKPKEFKVNISFLRIIKIGNKLKIIVCIIIIIFISGFTVWYFIFKGLPSPSDLTSRRIQVSTKIYDRNGVLLYEIFKDQNRTLVNLDIVPNEVKIATIASEDTDFYSNPGFSLKGIIRAFIDDLSNKDFSEGGSTITQQLVKNTLLTSQKTFLRKIKELILAIEIDKQYSKDQILAMYLNQVSYGGSTYGIEAASETYFGKDVSKLDLAQAAMLAGLPKSPTTYSPFGSHPDLAIQRQREVLKLMMVNGFISKGDEEKALNEKIIFASQSESLRAPHFVMYVKQNLIDTYGEEAVESGGLNVITTLDYNIQKMTEEVVKRQIDSLKGFHVTNGAAIVMDPSSGEILAMVGSKDYFDTGNDGNVNVTISLRSPGSSIKIVNYAYALSHGFTPDTILSDESITFNFPGYPSYSPINYDGKFVGNISLKDALAQSRNVPAVKVLASYGVNHMVEMGWAMGITTWNEEHTYGLSLTLGGGSTKLIDMARVYATVANTGIRPPLISVRKITDYKANNLDISCDSGSCNFEKVLDPKVANELVDILKDNKARAPEFGEYSSLVIPNHPEVAVKTGTSNDLRDNLTIGFNKKYLVAVWVGNNDNSSMARIASGITGAAPIWNEIMSRLLN